MRQRPPNSAIFSEAMRVLKLEAQDLNPYIAMKVLNEDIKQRSDSFIALQREASRQQRLAHPNIATVYDFDRVGGVIFITMELLEGTPLDDYLAEDVVPRGWLSLEEALPIITSLGSALAYAHNSEIIHSDFKPSNCFLTIDKGVKVLDFGIARAVRKPGQEAQTLFDGSALGAITPSYASCEMLESRGDPHPGDDVYALGCVTYE
ncbi:MAG: serine/threonine protein kinase [Gammaproteobacteria bacterium]|jgi:serine/threonine protein kinase